MSRWIWRGTSSAGKRSATPCGNNRDEKEAGNPLGLNAGRQGAVHPSNPFGIPAPEDATTPSAPRPQRISGILMNKVHFIFGVHNHQPIGNFDFVFEKAYEKSYLPFLDVMERHPGIHWNMHTTGILWEWLEKHRPPYLERVSEQDKQGRLELL